MAQVPPKATLMVAVEQLVLYYLALHLIWKHINSESWVYIDVIMLKNCDNQLNLVSSEIKCAAVKNTRFSLETLIHIGQRSN